MTLSDQEVMRNSKFVLDLLTGMMMADAIDILSTVVCTLCVENPKMTREMQVQFIGELTSRCLNGLDRSTKFKFADLPKAN